MKRKLDSFIIYFFIFFIILCSITFSCVFLYTNQKTRESITQIGNIYMEGISEKNVQHFKTIVTLRTTQLNSLTIDAEDAQISEETWFRALEKSAKARGFVGLSIYFKSQESVNIYGGKLELENEDSFISNLLKDEMQVTSGTLDNEKVIAFSLPYTISFPNGKETMALVGCLGSNRVAESLFGGEEDSLISSLIISQNGNYVIRDAHEVRHVA